MLRKTSSSIFILLLQVPLCNSQPPAPPVDEDFQFNNVESQLATSSGQETYVEQTESVVDEFCRYIFDSCPAIATVSDVPWRNDTTGRLDIGLSLVPMKMIGIDEITESFTMQAEVKISWRMPECATWAGIKQLGPNASKRLNDSVSASNLPGQCLYPKYSLYFPLILHANAVDDTYCVIK